MIKEDYESMYEHFFNDENSLIPLPYTLAKNAMSGLTGVWFFDGIKFIGIFTARVNTQYAACRSSLLNKLSEFGI